MPRSRRKLLLERWLLMAVRMAALGLLALVPIVVGRRDVTV